MPTKEEFIKQLTEQLEGSDFLKWYMDWWTQDRILARCLDEVMDWKFTIQIIDNEEHDLLVDWMVDNLYWKKWKYVEIDTMFTYDWDSIEDTVEALASRYQEYLDMYWFFNWVN